MHKLYLEGGGTFLKSLENENQNLISAGTFKIWFCALAVGR